MRMSGATRWRATAAALGLGALAAAFSPPAAATPMLQVDVAGGFYDTTSETVLTGDDVFTAYAYLSPKGGDDVAALLADTYYFSVALVPKTGPDPANLGSFSVDSNATVSGGAKDGASVAGGLTFAVTSNMVFGTPPVESEQLHDGGDLGQHDIFDTFFIELAFSFDSSNQAAGVNVEDDPGLGPQAGSDMYYHAFDFDISQLTLGYDLHFDLYNTKVGNCGRTGTGCEDIDADDFAPFSHDGGTSRTTFTTTVLIPEPGTLGLMGLGLFGLGLAARRSRRGRGRA